MTETLQASSGSKLFSGFLAVEFEPWPQFCNASDRSTGSVSQVEATGRSQDSTHFGKHLLWLRIVEEADGIEDGIKTAIAKGQDSGITLKEN